MSDLPPLDPAEFDDAFHALHGVSPFPWQRRLLRSIIADGGAWPATLTLPPGAGRGALLDVALFHLALDAGAGRARRAPLRIVVLTDRLAPVSAAARRAERMAGALAARPGGVIGRVARRLAMLAGPDAEPLRVRSLHPRPLGRSDWVASVTQPTILCADIESGVSRLLFRGLGLAEAERPVEAGLLGTDCLLILGDLQPGSPLAGTLGWVARHRARRDSDAADGPWQVVSLAPLRLGAPGFTLDAADHADPTLSRRLAAPRRARLHLLPVTSRDQRLTEPHAPFARAVTRLSLDLAGAPGMRRLAVVLNRLDLARAVATRLRAETSAAVHLVHGYRRPGDDDGRAIADAFSAGEGAPRILVATQAFECLPGLEVDALVTQLAPLDVLVRRFARLRGGGAPAADSIVVASRNEAEGRKPDPIHGEQGRLTWAWLKRIAARPARRGADPVADFGVQALAGHLAALEPGALGEGPAPAPPLRSAELMLLSWTSPTPSPDPDLGCLIHGIGAGCGLVHVVWRDQANPAASDEPWPPAPEELLPLPLQAARAWLSGDEEAAEQVSDLIGTPVAAPGFGPAAAFHRWSPAMAAPPSRAFPEDLAPGEVIVLPRSQGGYGRDGWDPRSREPVPRSAHADRSAAPAPIGPAGEEDVASGAGEDGLRDHLRRVAAEVRRAATALGLEPALAADLALAAELHDIGMLDPRYQLFLYGGDRIARARRSRPAASGPLPPDRIRRLAGLPEAWRHEVQSLLDARSGPDLQRAHDPALVLWLIGTHHGQGRPFFAHDDLSSGAAASPVLDLSFEGDDWPTLQQVLARRYGVWQLARLEALLRLADRGAPLS